MYSPAHMGNEISSCAGGVAGTALTIIIWHCVVVRYGIDSPLPASTGAS